MPTAVHCTCPFVLTFAIQGWCVVRQVPNGPTCIPPNFKSSLAVFAVATIATSPVDLSKSISEDSDNEDVAKVAESVPELPVDSVLIAHCRFP